MSIRTEKVSEDEFYDVDEFSNEVPWLKNREYQKGLLALWTLYCEEPQKKLIMDLLRRLKHLDSYSMSDLAYKVVDQIVDWECVPKKTVIIATSNGNEIDGSVSGLQQLKDKFSIEDGWREKNLFPNFEASFDFIATNKIENAIIFDDYIGSGKTMIKKINSLQKSILSKNLPIKSIYVVSFIGMNSGLEEVITKTGLKVFCPLILKKGISDFENSELAKKLIIEMKKMENKLQQKNLQPFSLGYGKSESLYKVFGLNCSNNVFPIFWWPTIPGGKYRDTLFRRAKY